MANLRRRARQQANVRFAGEERGLAALMAQTESDFARDVGVATATSRAGAAAARASRKPLRKAYRSATNAVDTAAADVATAFGNVGPGSALGQAITDREFGLERARIRGEGAAAQRDAIQRRRDAKVGRVFGINAAATRRNAALEDLLSQAQALRGEKGEFAAATLAELQAARDAQNFDAEQNALNRATQLAVAGRDEKGNKIDDKDKEREFKPATREDLRQMKNWFTQASDAIETLAKVNAATRAKTGKTPFSREAMRKALTNGLDYTQPLTPQQEAQGIKPKTLKVSAVEDLDAINAALDMHFKGYVSRPLQRKLFNAGFRVPQLPGAVTKRRWRQQGGNRSQINDATGAAGQVPVIGNIF